MTVRQLHTFGPRGASPSALPTEEERGARLGDTPPSRSLAAELHSAPDPYEPVARHMARENERLQAEIDFVRHQIEFLEAKEAKRMEEGR